MARTIRIKAAQPQVKLVVYTIVENSEGKSFWRLIGNAYRNRDDSLTVLLDALPINGRLHIREKLGGGDE